MKGRAIQYRPDELDFIEETATAPRREAHAAFCRLFGRTDVSLGAFTSLCKRNGWLTGRDGRYPAGSTPANKGKKMPFNANRAKTQFKKGARSGVAVKLYKPIGTERVSKDGYPERKIHDGMPLQSRWRAVHLIRWEDRHGPVPEGYCLKCLDGDKRNTDPDNWACIPRALLPRLAGRWATAYDDAPAELKPVILATAKLAHAAKSAGRKEGAKHAR